MSHFYLPARKPLIVLILTSILLCLVSSSNDFVLSTRPNILLILADDLGNNDIATWGDGKAPTPAMDALSAQAVRFRRFYTDSTCSPSRAELLSGRPPVSIGFQPNAIGLPTDLDTLPKTLQKLGYKTAHIGKWHVGEALEYRGIDPGHQGFDYWFGMLNHFVLRGPGPNGEILQREPTYIAPWLQENGAPPQQHHGYLDNILTDKAISLISKGGATPWFINLWLLSPHTPYQPDPASAHQFPDTPQGKYMAMLKGLDHNLARLLDALHKSGQAANTIVIFASDNGGINRVRDNNYPLVGKKAQYTEGGVRTPFLLLWPGHYEDRDIRTVTSLMDIYPTLISLVGGEQPKGLTGRNLQPLLNGHPIKALKELYWASDVDTPKMSYAGHLLQERRFFYVDMFGQLESNHLTPPINDLRSKEQPVKPFDIKTADMMIKKWEKEVRFVPLQWIPASTKYPAHLTGRDFQRAPLLNGYSIGMELRGMAPSNAVQTLLAQKGVWDIRFLPDNRLQVQYGVTQFTSKPVTPAKGCNSLVVTASVQPSYHWPFFLKGYSRLIIYWNGQSVLDSTELIKRPDTERPLANPTYIGSRPDGTLPYLGDPIAQPTLINKFLIPSEQGYALPDLLSTMCRKL
ncbi:MAG: sulfatase-like hydrolase/transferase [Pseudomonadota bacterium]